MNDEILEIQRTSKKMNDEILEMQREYYEEGVEEGIKIGIRRERERTDDLLRKLSTEMTKEIASFLKTRYILFERKQKQEE